MKKTSNNILQECDTQMEHYVAKRVFSGMPRKEVNRETISYFLKWHMGRIFELKINRKTQKVSFPKVLTDVEKGSKLDKDFRCFVKSLVGENIDKHRRLAKSYKSVRVINRSGNLSLSVAYDADDSATVISRIIAVVHQIYTLFLRNGGYDEYLVDSFGIDLDSYY